MIQPLRSKAPRADVSRPAVLPSPTKGWYVGANLAEAPPGTAYVLNNGFPQLDYVRVRRGTAAYATGMSGTVNTLMPYVSPSGSKFFAVNSGKIYEVTNSGAVGAAAVTGLNAGATMEYTQFTGSGGTFLVGMNGVDPSQVFNGSAWGTSPAITGLTGNQLTAPWAFKNRLYAVEVGSLNAWYLGLDSIGGAAVKFPLTSIFSKGGYLVAGGTWSIDSNSGLYEVCVFITSEGQIAFYDGADPTVWSLKGTYPISKPLGRRCLLKTGGDMAIMTEDGIVPMSGVMSLDQIALQNKAITLPIAPAWRTAVIARAGLSGWQIMTWPLESMAVVCLPKLTASDNTQFIANARTGAWAQYLGWDANCFALYNNNLYFGSSDGRVMQAETGGQDDGGNYTFTVFPAYSHLSTKGIRKQVLLVQPHIQSSFPLTPQVTIKADYATTLPPAPSATAAIPAGAKWDVAKWDVDVWPADLADSSHWIDAQGIGTVISPVLQLTISTSLTPDIRLTSTDVIYENLNIVG